MAFNWDFNCVRWSKSIEYKTRRYLSACARPLCEYARCPSASPSSFSFQSRGRTTRVQSRMCHAMHDICILKAYREGRAESRPVKLDKGTNTLPFVQTQRCSWSPYTRTASHIAPFSYYSYMPFGYVWAEGVDLMSIGCLLHTLDGCQ